MVADCDRASTSGRTAAYAGRSTSYGSDTVTWQRAASARSARTWARVMSSNP